MRAPAPQPLACCKRASTIRGKLDIPSSTEDDERGPGDDEMEDDADAEGEQGGGIFRSSELGSHCSSLRP